MSFIPSTIRCKKCEQEMNVAFGILGTTQMWEWPKECSRCHADASEFEKIADGWHAGESPADAARLTDSREGTAVGSAGEGLSSLTVTSSPEGSQP